MVSLAGAHSVLGERYIIGRFREGALPPLFGGDTFTRATLRFAWHALTIAWFALAALLVLVPVEAHFTVGWVTVAALGTTAAMTFVLTRGRHLSWVVELVAIVALVTAL